MNTFRVNLFGGHSIESKHKALVTYFVTSSRIIIIFKNCPVELVVIFLYENPLRVVLVMGTMLSVISLTNKKICSFFVMHASISDHHKIFSRMNGKTTVCSLKCASVCTVMNWLTPYPLLPLHSWLWFIRYTVPTFWNVDVLHVRLLVMLFNTIFLSIMR